MVEYICVSRIINLHESIFIHLCVRLCEERRPDNKIRIPVVHKGDYKFLPDMLMVLFDIRCKVSDFHFCYSPAGEHRIGREIRVQRC